MKECTQRDTLELQLRGILDDYVIFLQTASSSDTNKTYCQ